MKNLFIFCFLMVNVVGRAQEGCSPYYPSKTGQTLVVHQLNKKGKLNVVTEYRIQSATDSIITLNTALFDKKGKEIVTGNFKVTCLGEETVIEPESIIDPSTLKQFQNMKYSITGDGIRLPNTLEVGQHLPDSAVEMKVDAGIMNMNVSVTMTDRKVERKEQLTTPAGTFDCYVISYTNTLTMGTSKAQYATQWIAKGMGMIQQEIRKENGKLISKSILNEVRTE
ncbi:hypothetical protein ABN763_14290 [Spongiivirga sp. MCCC 1A20706]|uniref:TapB family protein n=1 Tax=Spongiivirga sp. MCCC 1A20706 TaxID=3160963 RepID=UPI00397734DC